MLLHNLHGEPVVKLILLRPLSTRTPKDCREYTEPTKPHISWYCFNSMRAAMMWVQGICCLMDVAAASIRPIPQIHFECPSHGSILRIVVLVITVVTAINPITTSLHIEVRSSVDSPFLIFLPDNSLSLAFTRLKSVLQVRSKAL